MSSSTNSNSINAHRDLTDEIVAGRLTIQQALGRIAHERDGETRAFQVPCDNPGCGKLHLFTETHSPCLWMACPGSPLINGFQLQEQPGNSASPPHQHFCCSQACVEQMLLRCLREHYYPEAQRRHQAETARRAAEAQAAYVKEKYQ